MRLWNSFVLALSTQQSTTVAEPIWGYAQRFGDISFFASHSKFLLWIGIVVVAMLLVFLRVRRRALRSVTQGQKAASQGAPLAAKPAADMATRGAPPGMWAGRRRFGLPWKIAKTFAGTTLFIGLVIIGAVYYVMADAVQRQVNQRGLTIATNLSDSAVTYVLAKNAGALNKVLLKYAQLPEVAYAFIENRQGEVAGSSLKELPSELVPLLGGHDLRNLRRAPATLAGKNLRDTRVPLLNGEIGAVHVGIWQSAVDREVNQALIPITGLLVMILILAVMLAMWIARRVSRPILSLAQNADQISRGDLDLPVAVTSNDELGELSRSIERLRASLKAAIRRLDRQESSP